MTPRDEEDDAGDATLEPAIAVSQQPGLDAGAAAEEEATLGLATALSSRPDLVTVADAPLLWPLGGQRSLMGRRLQGAVRPLGDLVAHGALVPGAHPSFATATALGLPPCAACFGAVGGRGPSGG